MEIFRVYSSELCKDSLPTIYNDWTIDMFMKFRTYLDIVQAKESEQYHMMDMERKAQQKQ